MGVNQNKYNNSQIDSLIKLRILATCMLLICIESLISASVGRALSINNKVLRNRHSNLLVNSFYHSHTISTYSATPLICGSRLIPVKATEKDDNENSSNNASEENNRVPTTGWNHNLPSDSSRFWKAPNGDSAAARQRSSYKEDTNNKDKDTPRTGWLHNTKPKKEDSDETKPKGISKAQQRLQQAMKQQEENHRIIYPPTFHACGNDRQIVVTKHRLSVPVYRSEEKKSIRIDIAFTVVEEIKDDTVRKFYESLKDMSPSQRAISYVDQAALTYADEMMLYLQGGPGFGSPVPVAGLAFSKDSSWGAAALNKYKRIVLMDQRGTGQSTPITKQSLQNRFPDLFALDDKETANNSVDELASSYPEEFAKFQAALKEATNYMAQFRADNIVLDAEMIREALLLPHEASSTPVPRPWGCSLGQSFGGFCTMSYLSLVEHPPKVALLTGGIAPYGLDAFSLYSKLWSRVQKRNLEYYKMYPGDIKQVKKIVQKLLLEPAPLPSGGKLTARRFLQLGMMLGGSPSSFASMHNMISTAFLQPEENELTRSFLKAVDNAQPFDEHPIYFWLHESIYADGPKFSPTNWSSDRAFNAKVQNPSEFDYRLTSQLPSDDRPTLFFGEMVFSWMSEDYAECGGLGCTVLANALAIKDDWGRLYDGDRMRSALADGRTRSAAAVYYDDMYVDFDCCMDVTGPGGPLEKCKVYITNDYQHSGLRDDGANIFTKLHGMATGCVQTPS